jgi:hypothetical protein
VKLLRILPPLLLLCILVLAPGCRKDARFTNDPNARLEFSNDTVLFDTVFTTVGSVTKRFTVRNRNTNAVRVNIGLEGGSTSPYRINVDGSSGLVFEGVEILGGDSLFVFVEVTLGPGGVNTPFVIEDHILFNTNGNVQKVLLAAWGQDAHFYRPDRFIQGFPPFSIIAGGTDENGNTICEEVTWPNDKPYVLYGYAVVDSCSTLRIDPGVRVYVHGGGGLWIYRYGRILAEGTVQERITFQSDRLEPLYQDLPGQWDRIWINEGPEGQDHLLQNVEVRNALIGIQCETFPLNPMEPTSAARLLLENVVVRNSSLAGILSRNFRITSNNLLVADAGQFCVALTGGGEYEFNHSTIANFWNFSIRQSPAFVMTNTYEDIFGSLQVRPITGSLFRNGIIHGSNTNEFLIEVDNAAPVDYAFRHFMLRTDQNTSGPQFDQPTIWRNQNPGFVSTTEKDFRLTQASFARNKGESTPGGVFDLLGQLRNCDPNAPGIDLGCYEWCP